MDRPGACWRVRGAEAVLRLRALRASGDFDAYWHVHLAPEQARHHATRCADHQLPASLPALEPRLRRISRPKYQRRPPVATCSRVWARSARSEGRGDGARRGTEAPREADLGIADEDPRHLSALKLAGAHEAPRLTLLGGHVLEHLHDAVAVDAVYLFASPSDHARVLTAIVRYGVAPVPAAEREPVLAALAERDQVCELLDAVQTDPTSHLGEVFVHAETDEQADADDGSGGARRAMSNRVVCGARAVQDGRTAARRFSRWGAVCGRFDCYDRSQRGNGQSGLHAERDSSGHLQVVASWEGYAGQTASWGGVRRAIAAHPCPVVPPPR